MHIQSLLAIAVALSLSAQAQAEILVDFEDLTLSTNAFYNGGPTENTDGWTSNGVKFGNQYSVDPVYGGFWGGWAYSNITDNTTPGFGNQYSAFAGGGQGGSGIYAIGYSTSQTYFNLPDGMKAQSALLTNSTYTALDMIDGSEYSRNFTTGDKFSVVFTGYRGFDKGGSTTGQVTFDLADFTLFNESDPNFDDPNDFVISDWTPVDFTALGNAKSVGISFLSTDNGAFGINTPVYVAMDNLTITAVPEPGSLIVLAIGGALGAYRLRRKNLVIAKQ
jgi:hypothetical protein